MPEIGKTPEKPKMGRPRTCECGLCPICKRREKKARYRDRQISRLEDEYGVDLRNKP